MIEQLKKRIKRKFGSISTFAKLIKTDRYELQKFFAAAEKKLTDERKTRAKQLTDLVKSTKRTATSDELTPEIRQAIKDAIEKQFGNVPAFCEQKGFNSFSVWQIINGNRKLVTPMVNKMLKILNLIPDGKEV